MCPSKKISLSHSGRPALVVDHPGPRLRNTYFTCRSTSRQLPPLTVSISSALSLRTAIPLRLPEAQQAIIGDFNSRNFDTVSPNSCRGMLILPATCPVLNSAAVRTSTIDPFSRSSALNSVLDRPNIFFKNSSIPVQFYGSRQVLFFTTPCPPNPCSASPPSANQHKASSASPPPFLK